MFILPCWYLCHCKASEYTPSTESCAYAKQLGVQIDRFPEDVAHGIHSLTVQDLRYFFDKEFPEKNSIPTTNSNLTREAPAVLSYAPSIISDSRFLFPAGQLIDFIMSNNEAGNNFYMYGATPLEKILHGAHMLETWNRASMAYKIVKESSPTVWKLCPCLMSEEMRIVKKVNFIAAIIRSKYPDPDPVTGERIDKHGFVVPSLDKNPVTAWKWWRISTVENVDDASVFHLAMYIYCKFHTSLLKIYSM